MYSQAKSCVRKGNLDSDYFTCNIGLRQGENLSPLLFSLFINDFESFISRDFSGVTPQHSCYPDLHEEHMTFIKLFTLLYADDTIVLSESETELQMALDSVHQYCSLWNLTVNTIKTKIVIFSRGKVRKFPVFKFGDSDIDVVSDYIYLGITFNYNNKFSKAIKKQLDQGRRAMFSMLVKARRLCLPIDIQCDLFDKMIVPIILYGSEVWGFHTTEMLEVFYRKFIKNILKLNKSTPSGMVYGEVGKLCLQTKMDKSIISYWLRLIMKDNTTLVQNTYTLSYQLFIHGIYQSVWLTNVKAILDHCGMSYIWDNQQLIDTGKVKAIIHKRIDDIEIQKWYTSISASSMCVMYTNFKTEYQFEKYLLLPDCKSRIQISKLRCRNLKLPVKTHVYLETSNICNLCDSQLVGDEYHYMLICTAFQNERMLYIKKYYYSQPCILKFVQLMTKTGTKHLKHLAKFVSAVSKHFK